MENFKIEELTIIILYNDYFELSKDLNNFQNSFEEFFKAREVEDYKIAINSSNLIIPGLMPLITIIFKFPNEKQEEYILNIDTKSMKFTKRYIENKKNTNVHYIQTELDNFIEIFIQIWSIFNKIANRSILERLGFISLFDLGKFSAIHLLKKIPPYKYVSIRFFDIILEDISPFENTGLVPNAIIDPKLDDKTHCLISYKFINDIATIPNSKGIIHPSKLKEGLKKLKNLTLKNIKNVMEVLKSE